MKPPVPRQNEAFGWTAKLAETMHKALQAMGKTLVSWNINAQRSGCWASTTSMSWRDRQASTGQSWSSLSSSPASTSCRSIIMAESGLPFIGAWTCWSPTLAKWTKCTVRGSWVSYRSPDHMWLESNHKVIIIKKPVQPTTSKAIRQHSSDIPLTWPTLRPQRQLSRGIKTELRVAKALPDRANPAEWLFQKWKMPNYLKTFHCLVEMSTLDENPGWTRVFSLPFEKGTNILVRFGSNLDLGAWSQDHTTQFQVSDDKNLFANLL